MGAIQASPGRNTRRSFNRRPQRGISIPYRFERAHLLPVKGLQEVDKDAFKLQYCSPVGPIWVNDRYNPKVHFRIWLQGWP
jgi:hypothetical protein